MALTTWYSTGTVSVEGGSTTVTGANLFWGDEAIMPGDLFCDPAQPLVPPQRVRQVTSDNELELWAPWPGTTIADAPYEIRYVGIIERSTAQTRRVLEQLGDVKAYFDIQVGTLADRDAFNARPARFRVLVSDIGDGRAAIYSKNSSADGDWSEPAMFSGPAIELDVASVVDAPFGSEPDVTLSPRPGGYDMSFIIPEGMRLFPGATTTLPPDQPAQANFVPVEGGFRLDLAIPRGPTGDIDGVTPFWVSRLGADGDAEAARLGLNAQIAGDYELAQQPVSQSDAEAGVIAEIRSWSPERIAQAIAALAPAVPADVYRRANILGPVSQNGGVPTGGIIERGENANGTYVRWADGTQFCWGEARIDPTPNEVSSVTWIYPAVFVGTPGCQVTTYAASAVVVRPAMAASMTETQTDVNIIRTNSTQTGVGIMAMGRWF
ncbi:MAG TPA: hypothetical protein VNS12_13635 [Pelagibacterium sp.]|uniref:hypothetical protein n=1 Tax=Pelagibacterium sp. TaxID=1967288 RepID=UPI002C377EA5|nr:hypothetical protein [Pelagibacterium sp.]HWJ89104.1 hypothetical protein [Pelagibacterium sp.]